MIRGLIRGTGEICITFGLLLLFFVAYELWGTGQYTHAQQNSLAKKLDEEWAKPAAKGPKVTSEKIKLGDGIAMIRIPRFGKNTKFVVVEGVTVADLRKGPGHYPKTALPGQLGNFVVSGHRTTYGAPFNKAAELRQGDQILVDTRDKQYVYKVTGHQIVQPTELDVIAPVPFHPGRLPSKKMITLTTCHPKYSAAQRYIVFGELVSEVPRVTAPSKKAA
ncbi:class E sortase [Actinocorallia longicatena]|uniref:Sortase A n=1 Tax=Actinocorallia longicatena TaxID=111803 RepID=A0ABP6QCN0_9ACTN